MRLLGMLGLYDSMDWPLQNSLVKRCVFTTLLVRLECWDCSAVARLSVIMGIEKDLKAGQLRDTTGVGNIGSLMARMRKCAPWYY